MGLPMVAVLMLAFSVGAADSTISKPQDWSKRQLSLAEALDLALQQNGTILKGKSDLEAAHGIVVQTRAIALPKVRFAGQFQAIAQNAVDFPTGTNATLGVGRNWGRRFVSCNLSTKAGGSIRRCVRRS